jgi:hypothetical protein
VAKPVILLSPRFHDSIKKFSAADLARIEQALLWMPDSFGQPHAHAGLSIRRLRANIFECRAGLKIRLLFRARLGALEFFFAGSHDDVSRLIRNL